MINIKINDIQIDNKLISDEDLDNIFVTKGIAVTFSNKPSVSISHNIPKCQSSLGILADTIYAKNNIFHKFMRFINLGL